MTKQWQTGHLMSPAEFAKEFMSSGNNNVFDLYQAMKNRMKEMADVYETRFCGGNDGSEHDKIMALGIRPLMEYMKKMNDECSEAITILT